MHTQHLQKIILYTILVLLGHKATQGAAGATADDQDDADLSNKTQTPVDAGPSNKTQTPVDADAAEKARQTQITKMMQEINQLNEKKLQQERKVSNKQVQFNGLQQHEKDNPNTSVKVELDSLKTELQTINEEIEEKQAKLVELRRN